MPKLFLLLTLLSSFAAGKIVEISGRHGQQCVRFDDGKLKCWGFNSWYALGFNTSGDYADPSKLDFIDLGKARADLVSAGWNSTCALLDTGSVLCWGDGKTERKTYA